MRDGGISQYVHLQLSVINFHHGGWLRKSSSIIVIEVYYNNEQWTMLFIKTFRWSKNPRKINSFPLGWKVSISVLLQFLKRFIFQMSPRRSASAPATFQYLMKHFVILTVIEDHYGKTNIYANANIWQPVASTHTGQDIFYLFPLQKHLSFKRETI